MATVEKPMGDAAEGGHTAELGELGDSAHLVAKIRGEAGWGMPLFDKRKARLGKLETKEDVLGVDEEPHDFSGEHIPREKPSLEKVRYYLDRNPTTNGHNGSHSNGRSDRGR